MYSEARLQFTLVTKNSYNKGIQLCVECARNNIERDKITESTEVLDKSIFKEVLLIKEIFLVSSHSRANESSILTRISKFSLILIIVDKEIIKSSLSAEESRVFLITTIFNNNDITVAGLVKSFELFLLLNILLLLLSNTSNKVISSIKDNKTISAQRVLYNIKKVFYNNKSTFL